LEGGTGVGKSATIKAAAELTGNKLVRFNMSRTVTIDDLLGQIKMDGKNSFKFNPQPFTVAFQNGYWLLLDEINLAEEKVLQCIEEAIDIGKLILQDLSSADQTILCIPVHENFRLFATQNPNSGFFKGLSLFTLNSFVNYDYDFVPR
jgi:midasin